MRAPSERIRRAAKETWRGKKYPKYYEAHCESIIEASGLQDDLERALDALRPFAEYAAKMMRGLPESVAIATLQDNVNGDTSITRADVLRAAAVLDDLTAETEEA